MKRAFLSRGTQVIEILSLSDLAGPGVATAKLVEWLRNRNLF